MLLIATFSLLLTTAYKTGFYGKYIINPNRECKSIFPSEAVGMGTPWVAWAVGKGFQNELSQGDTFS